MLVLILLDGSFAGLRRWKRGSGWRKGRLMKEVGVGRRCHVDEHARGQSQAGTFIDLMRELKVSNSFVVD